MNPRAFLDLAQELLGGPTEAHWRAAAGRAYYAVMLQCRDTLERWGFMAPPRDQVHTFVRLRFVYAPDRDMQFIGSALEDLGRLRNRADYQLNPSRPFANAVASDQAVQQARQALVGLDQVDADLPRRAAIIAGIRAAFP
jgi:hypothetical protein